MSFLTPWFLHCSICCREAALKETNREWPRVYSHGVIFNMDLLIRFFCGAAPHKGDVSAKTRSHLQSTAGGVASGKESLKKNGWSSCTWVTQAMGFQGIHYSPCCIQPSITLQVLRISSKKNKLQHFFPVKVAQILIHASPCHAFLGTTKRPSTAPFPRPEAAEPKTTKKKS